MARGRLYLTGFVETASGGTVWNIANALLGDVRIKRNAAKREPENLSVPQWQLAHSPELQPDEHLWALVDKPPTGALIPSRTLSTPSATAALPSSQTRFQSTLFL